MITTDQLHIDVVAGGEEEVSPSTGPQGLTRVNGRV